MQRFPYLIDDNWLIRLITNHFGYIIFAIPIVLLFLIAKKSLHSEWSPSIRNLINILIRLFISDSSNATLTDVNTKDNHSSTSATDFTRHYFCKLIFAFFGLQISYLFWGLLQERIMTRTYSDEKFSNSQFLVFVNRFLAVIVAHVSMKILYPTKKLALTGSPLYRYGIISYANCMSTWFQYESLLYISFPVQVIAKSIKTIPVMLVGRFVSGKTYPMRQYFFMFIMAIGIGLFLSGYQENGLPTKRARHNITTFNGIILLVLYLIFDAFTSNYQKYVFDRYSISFLQMMFFVNLISTILTFISLLFNGTLFECLAFMQRHQVFTMHVLATSICSAIGQLFIFSTIEQFGPVIFTIIMTMRQAFSILLSCIFYGHHLNSLGIVGIHLAFLAIFIHAFMQFKRTKQSNANIV